MDRTDDGKTYKCVKQKKETKSKKKKKRRSER